MNAIVKSNCSIAKGALKIFSGYADDVQALDTVVKGLKVTYSNDIEISSYLDFLDGKSTKAIRELIKKLMSDPYTAKYSERLSAKLCDINREIEEIGKSRAAKFYQAVSDIAVYGGAKYLDAQSGSLIKPRKQYIQKTSEWIASKLFDIHAKVTGKDWTLAQIYKTRTKIEKCQESFKDAGTQ